MKIRSNAIASVAAALFAASVLTACTSTSAPPVLTKEIESHRAGDLVIALQSVKGEMTQGENDFVVEFRSAANNRPVDAGTVTVSASMAMPGMTPMTAVLELKRLGQVGRYAVKGSFGMSGSWRYEIRWDGPAGQGSTSFQSNVR